MDFPEYLKLVFHLALSVVGIIMVLFIVRIYRLYKSLKIRRSVMTPMLLAGVFTALSGITELSESYTGEIGEVIHAVVMFLTGVFFFYGIFGYHQMLGKNEKPR